MIEITARQVMGRAGVLLGVVAWTLLSCWCLCYVASCPMPGIECEWHNGPLTAASLWLSMFLVLPVLAGAWFGVSWLWDKNPSIRIGRKPKLPRAEVVR